MITTLNEWRQIYELVDPDMNSDKNVKLKEYQDTLDYYNKNKNQFDSILRLDEDKQEDAASKVINGNTYLGLTWKMMKMQASIDKVNDELKGEITDEERQDINKNVNDNKNKLREMQYELQKNIKQDLDNIKKL